MNHTESAMILDELNSTEEDESKPQKNKVKKHRLSLNKPQLYSPEATSRYGRTRKPKLDCGDFLPTDAVLGKSPKSPKKEKKKIVLNTLSLNNEPISDDVFSDVAYIRDCSFSLLNKSSSTLSESSPEEDNDKSLNHPINDNSVEESFQEEVITDYEPGDLIWGRVGHHPFWPCIIINDPEFKVFYKTTGHGRLMYHVLFYGDDGKRSWVASSMVLRFLGLQDFQTQASAITSEMKKKDGKWFSGFFVKSATKQKWEAAVQEAEAAMPMTRDERVDAFLRSFPEKHHKSLKKSRDADVDYETENKESLSRDVSPEKVPKLKKGGNLSASDSSPQEKRKRGRPRKSEQSSQPKKDLERAHVKTPIERPLRVVKRKQSGDNGAVENSCGGDGGEESATHFEDMIMEDKEATEIGLRCFRAWYISHLSGHYANASNDVIESIVLQEWNAASNNEKAGWVPADIIDSIRARFGGERETEKTSKMRQHDTNSSDEEEKDDDGAGVEEEVATVAPSETEKAPADVTISKKKVNLFRGYRIEKVCLVCEKPGNTVKCRGPCSGTFHVECARGADNSEGTLQLLKDDDDKPRKRGRKKKIFTTFLKKEIPRVKTESGHKKIYAEEETDSDLEYNCEEVIDMNDPDIVMNMIMGDPSAKPEVSMLLEEESEEEEDDSVPNDSLSLVTDGKVYVGDFRCGDCSVLRTPLCFGCGQATDPSGLDSTRHRCSTGHCGKHFHEQCLKMWPQASHGFRKGVLHNLTCPQHVCHTCISDNPRDSIGRFSHERLVRCIRCPTSYHYGNYCVPAGSEILTATQMICPRHYKPPKKGTHHVNASWCFICSVGGSLICCDLCPSSIHVECLKIKPPTGSYICEDCETGRFPLYNEVLWVKLGTYRWWPALTLFPSEVPDNVKNRPHTLGEFAVRFLGTNDHYWVHRGRCFVFHEGDSVQDTKKTSKSYMDSAFQQGVKEANELHKAHKELRAKMQLQAQAKPCSMKPPQYVKIKTNKPVGKVKMSELDASNISPCECDPNSDHPCSPETDCLNRILLTECDPNICPAGERCENQFFEKRLYPALEPYRTDGRGWGLKTLVDVKKGSFVIEYVGEVIDDEEYQRRLRKKHDQKDENYYFLTIDSCRIIDAGPKGNVSRFMNHSCQPNCETQKWTVAGDTRVGLFALRDIPAGSELTFNYNLESRGNEKKPCMCGAAECSGFIGAKKKVLQPELKVVPSSVKKKRKKPRVRNMHEDICLLCNLGTEAGDLITCFSKYCATRYHLTCVGLSSAPQGKWLCGRHRCNLCEKRANVWCSYCTDSYCPLHLSDLLVDDPSHGYVCDMHHKNPPIEDPKRRREDERKQKEEEKRRRDEEERTQRRTRRERITSDEEVIKKKPKLSFEKEDTCETSSDDPIEDKPAESSSINFNSLKSDPVKVEVHNSLPVAKGEENVDIKPIHKKKRTPKSKLKGRSSTDGNHLNVEFKEGEDHKADPHISSSSHVPRTVKPKSKNKSPRTENYVYVNEIVAKMEMPDQYESPEAEGSAFNDVDSLINQSSDGEKDDVPGADPLLDKFMFKGRELMDDREIETHENKQSKFLKERKNTLLFSHASTSSNKKRRKQPPAYHQDYTKTFKKSHREMDEGMRGDLSNELQDVAMTFASDDSEDSPKLEIKKGKAPVRGRRRTLGVVRSRPADSTSKDGLESALYGTINHLSKVPSKSPPSLLKSPNYSQEKVSTVTSGGICAPSELFAQQRARGSKVLPPNRRLSLAREVASSRQFSNDFSDKSERAGKGLKVLKGRRPSLETSTTSKRTENLHGEAVQSCGMKRVRPVLSRVEDNGASLEDDVHEKVIDNNSTSIPKQSLPNSISSPPIKKRASHGNNQQPSELGVTPLWNQDILNQIAL